MEKMTRTTKTIRVSYCDPDATDSSSDEQSGDSPKKSKRKVHVIEVDFPRSDSRGFQEETRLNEPSLTSEANKMVVVKMTKSGEFWTEIKDPIKKRWVWPGFLGTAEEASRAFLAEEYKFAAAKLRANQRVEWAAAENSVPIIDHTNPTSAGKRIEGVRMKKSGMFDASIIDPLKKKKVWLGSFTTAEEASRAYLAKKSQIEAKLSRVEKARLEANQLRAKRRMDRAAAAAKSTPQDSLPSDSTRKRISLVRRNNSGKFTAQIRNPITEKLVWIGTFDTEEEATGAYLAMEAEFASDKWRTNRRISGVRMKRPGKYSAEIPNPITKKRVWIGDFANKAEATRAYLAKEAEFEEEFRAKEDLATVASEKSSAAHSVYSVLEIETSDLSSEDKVSGEQEVGFGFLNGVQVIDQNGFLVGEFSMLDDLSICSEMEDANSWKDFY